MIYPLIKNNKSRNENLYNTGQGYYTEECARSLHRLYLQDEFARNEKGRTVRYFRLNAVDDHTQEMALSYEIYCPKCGNRLKQIGRQLSFNKLGLYACPCCNKTR
ncbi:MAG: hypothetical protein K5770_06985 [Lachnospiraceae bacterium]|nr:hypothetical protein [Lachnospiraceae bacterium]